MIKDLKVTALGSDVAFSLDLDPDDACDAHLLNHLLAGKVYEPEVVWAMLRILKSGDFAIDVGASVGFFTVLMSKLVGETGRVLAFEPGRNVMWKLRKNVAHNAAWNVTVVQEAIGDSTGSAVFYNNADNSGGNALWDPALWHENVKTKAQNPESYRSYRVEVDTLTNFTCYENVKTINAAGPKLIKIDTEGAEQKVLEGADRLLATRMPPYIIAESNPFGLSQFGHSNGSLRRLMRSYGYETFLLHANGVFPSLVPTTVKLVNTGDVQTGNIMFSTMDAVMKAWPETVP